ncbi:MAG: methyl-accepting chemotaxis protein [bacterium]
MSDDRMDEGISIRWYKTLQVKFQAFFQIAATVPTLIRIMLLVRLIPGNEGAPFVLRTSVEIALQVLLVAVVAYLATRFLLTRHLDKIESAMGEAAKGNLGVRVRVATGDKLQLVAKSFNGMLANIASIFKSVLDVMDRLMSSSQELAAAAVESSSHAESISKSVQAITEGAANSAQAIESTMASVEEMTSSAQLVATNARQAAASSQEMGEVARAGSAAVSRTVENMDQIRQSVSSLAGVINSLNSASKQIGNIVGTISSIADQTNLLALNAAIEAARAGEHGRGFAVVAEEVRNLAEESGRAAREITKLIKDIQSKTEVAVREMSEGNNRVEEGSEIVNEAGSSLSRILDAVEKVGAMVQEISDSAQEQSDSVAQIAKAVENIAAITSDTANDTQKVSSAIERQMAIIQEWASSAEALKSMAVEVKERMSRFTLEPMGLSLPAEAKGRGTT